MVPVLGELVPSWRRAGLDPRDIPLPDVTAAAVPGALLLATSPSSFTAQPSLAGQQAFSQGPSALPPPQTQKNPKRRSFKLVLKAGRGSEPSFNGSETQAGSDSEVSGGIQEFASMAVEMEKEKHELVIPKPSNSWKSTGTPFAALSSLSRLKQAAQTLPMRSAHPRCKKANRKPNKRT